MDYVAKTDQELRQLALDTVAGQVFWDWHIDSDDKHTLLSVFKVLLFGGSEWTDEMTKNKIAHVYEYLSEAGPLAVNGRPSFFSVKMINEDDYAKLIPILDELYGQQKAFMENEATA